jgi:hypothetical protein
LNTPASPQRRWRAACPNCGAPVEFASAASPVAVCSFCRSTLAREGEALRRIGSSAELFDDHSPLQLGAAGRWQGVAFTVVGRLQLGYAEGRWNEWHVLFDNGRSGWLAEDNGRYVLGFTQATVPLLPARKLLLPGASVALEGRDWRVASRVQARVEGAEGELPRPPRLQQALEIVELRSSADEVGSLEFPADGAEPNWTLSQPVALGALALTGLRDSSEKTLAGRSAECPACGATLEIRLDSTRSVVCGQCRAVVDLSQGLGGELAHYAQENAAADGAGPQIPLGSTGRLDLGEGPRDWQVVGYVERCTQPEDPDDDVYFWREYLLYAREVGFAFLVDAEDGWSSAVPLAGAPRVSGEAAQWKGRSYARVDSYVSKTTWVLGEFYWRLARHERCHHIDYAAGERRLNREQSGSEVTWSEGVRLDSSVVARAFAVPPERQAAMRREVFSFQPRPVGGSLLGKALLVVVIVLVVLAAAMLDSPADECSEVRATFGAASAEYEQCQLRGRYAHSTSGGSYGGWSGGGGGHK